VSFDAVTTAARWRRPSGGAGPRLERQGGARRPYAPRVWGDGAERG